MVSQIPIVTKGFGTMSMTWTPQPKPFAESIKTLKYVKEKYGVKFFNCGQFYQVDPKFSNLDLINEFVKQEGTDIIVSIKGAVDKTLSPVGTKENIDKSIAEALTHFDKKPTLLFQISRVDPKVPYEDTISYIYEHVKKGEIDGISISEVSAKSIDKAVSVAPISAIEVELSLFTEDIIHNGILKTASEHGIPIIAYSPLCRGILTDFAAEHPDYLSTVDDRDFKKTFGKFLPDNYAYNKKRLDALYKFAKSKNLTLEALSLSYLESLSGLENYFEGIPKVAPIIPIPSGSTPEKVDNNFSTVKLSREDMDEIQKILETHKLKGLRYNAFAEAHLNG